MKYCKLLKTVLIGFLAAVFMTGCVSSPNDSTETRQFNEVQTEQVQSEPYQLFHWDYSNCEPNGKFKIRIHH